MPSPRSRARRSVRLGSSPGSGPSPRAPSRPTATSTPMRHVSSGTCSPRRRKRSRGTGWCAPTGPSRWGVGSWSGYATKAYRCAATASTCAALAPDRARSGAFELGERGLPPRLTGEPGQGVLGRFRPRRGLDLPRRVVTGEIDLGHEVDGGGSRAPPSVAAGQAATDPGRGGWGCVGSAWKHSCLQDTLMYLEDANGFVIRLCRCPSSGGPPSVAGSSPVPP